MNFQSTGTLHTRLFYRLESKRTSRVIAAFSRGYLVNNSAFNKNYVCDLAPATTNEVNNFVLFLHFAGADFKLNWLQRVSTEF